MDFSMDIFYNIRPTCNVRGFKDDEYPLRLIDIQKTLCDEKHDIIFKQPTNWKFAIVSHTWSDVKKWQFGSRPWPIAGGFTIVGVSKIALITILEFVHLQGYNELWIDCICVDQRSSIERQREVNNMGSYYRNSDVCFIFTNGIDNIGDPIKPNATSLPKWYNRVWTLQEMLLSKRNVYVFMSTKEIYLKYKYNTVAIMASMFKYNIDSYALCHNQEKNLKSLTRNRYKDQVFSCEAKICNCCEFVMYGVTQKKIESAFKLALGKNLSNNSEVWQEIQYHNSMIMNKNWTILEILRMVYKREASEEEDRVYGIAGLLNLNQLDVRYKVGIRHSLNELARVIHSDVKILLTAVEWYREDWLDGYCSLPVLDKTTWVERDQNPDDFLAYGINVDICIGTAVMKPDIGMEVTTYEANSRLNFSNLPKKQYIVVGDKDAGLFSTLRENIMLTHPDKSPVQVYGKVKRYYDEVKLLMVGKCSVPVKICNNNVNQVNEENKMVLVLVCAHAGNALNKIGMVIMHHDKVSTWKMSRNLLV